jgi:alpha-D-ribose 1-methylphosphonate 5-triphosphate synthase subunit PhnG
VITSDGQSAEGAAQVMDDRIEIAELLALCDAILSGRLPGHERVHAMIEQGLSVQREKQVERKRILAATQVDFSLLNDVGDETGETNA